jgi:hypothetical protein
MDLKQAGIKSEVMGDVKPGGTISDLLIVLLLSADFFPLRIWTNKKCFDR